MFIKFLSFVARVSPVSDYDLCNVWDMLVKQISTGNKLSAKINSPVTNGRTQKACEVSVKLFSRDWELFEHVFLPLPSGTAVYFYPFFLGIIATSEHIWFRTLKQRHKLGKPPFHWSLNGISNLAQDLQSEGFQQITCSR